MAQGLFLGESDAGPEPIRTRHLQKYLGPRQHSSKEGHLRRQAINLTPRRGLKPGGTAPFARGISSAEAYPARFVPQTIRPAEV